MLAAKRERDLVSAHGNVLLVQRRDAVGARGLRIAVGPDPEPAQIDQPHCDRTDALWLIGVEVHVLAHRQPEIGQLLGKAHELVVLRLLLLGAKLGVVEVLSPAGPIDTGRLQLRAGIRRDPHLFPGRRDHERLDPLELRLVLDPVAARVEIAKTPLRPRTTPSTSARHGGSLPRSTSVESAADGSADDRRARGGRNGPGAARRGAPRPRPRDDRGRALLPTLRSLARQPARDEERRRPRGRRGGARHPASG